MKMGMVIIDLLKVAFASGLFGIGAFCVYFGMHKCRLRNWIKVISNIGIIITLAVSGWCVSVLGFISLFD